MESFNIYKRGQGKYTRVTTFVAGVVLAAIGAHWLSERLDGVGGQAYGVYLQYGIPVVMLAGVAWLMFWVVNRPSSADFMIATEGEMKKVSWSSRREIVGSTKVVIFTTFALALLLTLVDVIFQNVFQWINVVPKITG